MHYLKCWTEYFSQITEGKKLFELRKDDRGFFIGDIIVLQEYCPYTGNYSKRSIKVIITSIVRNFEGLRDGYVILGIEPFKSIKEELEENIEDLNILQKDNLLW